VHGGTCVAATPYVFDSLAVEAGGRIAVAATSSGIVVITPDGGQTDVYSLPGDAASNIAFADDGRRAVITLSRSGRLVQTCKYALAAMERAGRGAIVNIASVAGLRGSVIGGIEATGYRRPSTV